MAELPNIVCSYSKYSRHGKRGEDEQRRKTQHDQGMPRERVACCRRSIRQRQPDRDGIVPGERRCGPAERGGHPVHDSSSADEV